jgi:hypothetical protein
MRKHRGRRLLPRAAIVALLGISVVAIPASAAPKLGQSLTTAALAKLSGGAVESVLLAHPEQAPPELRARFERAKSILAAGSSASSSEGGPQVKGVFNHDTDGVPQHETTVTRCNSNPNVVLGGTMDVRGYGLGSRIGLSGVGWHFSTDGGRSVANEGLLPPVAVLGSPAGDHVPASDPVEASDQACNLFAASNGSNVPEAGFVPKTNSIELFRSNPATLASCGGGDDRSCWPVGRAVAVNEDQHFLDKPWFDVGVSGSAGEVVWVVYTDFCGSLAPECAASAPFFFNQIKAVRCNVTLTSCTDPILISGDQNSLQFGDVTIGPDGRVYITWEEDNDLANGFAPPEHMRFWMRVAEPGSTTFGPLRLVANEPLNIGIAGLHANDFRVLGSYPKNDVATVNGHPRVFVVWDGCAVRTLGDTVCEEPQTKLVYSDDLGASFTAPQVISKSGDNYFSTISSNGDARKPKLAIAYYTSRFDSQFHNRQDIELVAIDAASGQVTKRERLTDVSNDPEADPISGSFFIGDYIEVTALGKEALVHFTANYRQVRLFGEGVPIPQQDNFLLRGELGD